MDRNKSRNNPWDFRKINFRMLANKFIRLIGLIKIKIGIQRKTWRNPLVKCANITRAKHKKEQTKYLYERAFQYK